MWFRLTLIYSTLNDTYSWLFTDQFTPVILAIVIHIYNINWTRIITSLIVTDSHGLSHRWLRASCSLDTFFCIEPCHRYHRDREMQQISPIKPKVFLFEKRKLNGNASSFKSWEHNYCAIDLKVFKCLYICVRWNKRRTKLKVIIPNSGTELTRDARLIIGNISCYTFWFRNI